MIEDVKCPICDGPMVSRANKATGQRFWGCRNYPQCKGTRNTDGEAQQTSNRFESHYEERHKLPSERARENDRRRW